MKKSQLSQAAEFLTPCCCKCELGQRSGSRWSCASVNAGNYSNHVCKLHWRFTHLLKPKSWKFIPISFICQGWSSVIHSFTIINNETTITGKQGRLWLGILQQVQEKHWILFSGTGSYKKQECLGSNMSVWKRNLESFFPWLYRQYNNPGTSVRELSRIQLSLSVLPLPQIKNKWASDSPCQSNLSLIWHPRLS